MDNNTELKLHLAIKNTRKSLRYSQAELAQKLGISQNAYSKIERGETAITMQRLSEIGEVLGINYLELINNLDSSKEEKESIKYTLREFRDDIEKGLEETYRKRVSDLEKIVESQSDTILLLKEKIAMLENKK